MLFDTMCSMLEQIKPYGKLEVSHSSYLLSTLRYSSLIRMPGIWGVGGGPYNSRSETEDRRAVAIPQIEEGFRMPWNPVAIEDSESCVMMRRVGSSKLDGSDGPLGEEMREVHIDGDTSIRNTTADIGLRHGDAFMVCVTYDVPLKGEFLSNTVSSNMFYKGGKAPWMVPSYILSAARKKSGGPTAWRWLTSAGDPSFRDLAKVLVDAAGVASWQLVRATHPGTWILRETVGPSRDPKHSAKIPRSHQRPRWLLITDKERTRYFRHDETPQQPGELRHVAPHPRRGHYRRIGDNDDGSPRHAWVRACWVGSTESEIRGARYTVELDL